MCNCFVLLIPPNYRWNHFEDVFSGPLIFFIHTSKNEIAKEGLTIRLVQSPLIRANKNQSWLKTLHACIVFYRVELNCVWDTLGWLFVVAKEAYDWCDPLGDCQFSLWQPKWPQRMFFCNKTKAGHTWMEFRSRYGLPGCTQVDPSIDLCATSLSGFSPMISAARYSRQH